MWITEEPKSWKFLCIATNSNVCKCQKNQFCGVYKLILQILAEGRTARQDTWLSRHLRTVALVWVGNSNKRLIFCRASKLNLLGEIKNYKCEFSSYYVVNCAWREGKWFQVKSNKDKIPKMYQVRYFSWLL